MFPTDPASSNLETQFTFEAEGQVVAEQPPFRMLFMGDWSGREFSPVAALIKPRPIVIDRDSFNDVMKRLNISLELDVNADGHELLNLRFQDLDDFHPDRIFERVSLFGELRDLRRRLLNPDSFDEAARQVRAWFDEKEPLEPDETAAEDQVVLGETREAAPGNLLDQILAGPAGDAASAAPSPAVASGELSRFIGNIVESHVVRTDENEQARLLETVDEATSGLMRKILHHPRYQALEAAWRSMFMLVRQVETDVDLKFYLLDVGHDELADNLKSVTDLEDTDLYQWLIRDTIETPGGEPWGAVFGNYSFGANVDDVAMLIRVAQLSAVADTPFISYIRPEMFGVSSIGEQPNQSGWSFSDDDSARKLWLTLRALTEAEYLGLAMPRFLSRLPYGEATDPAERFSFEEFTADSGHDNYLWANPSFACAFLLAKSFRANGWEDMGSNLFQDLSHLPTHFFEEDGETRTKPCAEVVMTETTCQTLLDEGFMPLISYLNSNRVVLARFQSIAAPNKPLKGRWN